MVTPPRKKTKVPSRFDQPDILNPPVPGQRNQREHGVIRGRRGWAYQEYLDAKQEALEANQDMMLTAWELLQDMDDQSQEEYAAHRMMLEGKEEERDRLMAKAEQKRQDLIRWDDLYQWGGGDNNFPPPPPPPPPPAAPAAQQVNP